MTPTEGRPDRLLMVMPYHQLVRKAVEAGFRVWSVWDPTLRDEAYLAEVARHSEELLLTDFTDEPGLRALIADIARRHHVGHVLHLGSEATMLPVAQEAEALGLAPNPAEAVRLLNDKSAMRQLLNGNQVSVVRYGEASDIASARTTAAEAGFPCIVKPARSAGSRGVVLAHGPQDLDAWADRVAAAGIDGLFVVEEYLEGPEFSVETLSADGQHHVIGITAKQTSGPPSFVETGHLHPAPLPVETAAAVRATVTALLDLAGHIFGPAHTEVIVTARGPRIVESQARLGGDRIPLLVQLATGFDIEAAIFRALAGEPIEVPAPYRSASIGFLQLPVGRLGELDGVAVTEALSYVHALKLKYRPGDTVPPVTDSSTRPGYVVVSAAGSDEVAARIAAARAAIRPRAAHPALTTHGASS